MRKWLFITALLIGPAAALSAQNKGRLEGRVKDEQDRPLPFATVMLIDPDSISEVKVVQTDAEGKFAIDEIPYGSFNCKITHTGYRDLTRDSIVFTPVSGTISLGDLDMIPQGKALTEVIVSGRNPTLRLSPEKKIFSVNQSLVSVGGTAADLLQNVPTLQVDANGNVSLRGATNLKVLVDGKTSLIGGGTIAQVLQSIPASAIDRVEIITSPSAKYDAEGEALVNIVLKKNTITGFNGSVAATAGTRDNYNIAAAVSYQNSRFNWYGNYSYQRRNTYSNGFQDMTYLAPPNPAYYSNETFPSITITDLHSAKAGVDYKITGRDDISVSGAYNASTTNRSEWLTVDNLTEAGLPEQLSTRHNGTTGDGNSYELTLDYTHTFHHPQKELNFDFDYSRGVTHDLQLYNTYISYPSDSTAVLKDDKHEDDRNYNVQLDYTTPVGKNGKLETGYRSQIGVTDNRQWDYNLDKNSDAYEPDYSLINFFKSTNQVHAAYVSYRQQVNTFTFQLGLRAEFGWFSAGLQSFDSSGNPVVLPITVDTKGLYPNLLVIKRLGEGRQLQLSYSRRVNRPTARELNPFFDVSDPVNYDAGNPRLLPESIHSVELTYSRTWSKASLSSGAYFTQINDVIKHIESSPVNDVVISTSQNLKWAINTGLEFIGNFHPLKAWDFTANVNIYERVNAGDSAFGIAATHGLSWNANLTSNYSPVKNLTLQVRADYKAADVIIQDRNRPAYGIDGAVRYDFWSKKASLALNGRDIFNTRKWRFLRESDALLLNFQRVTYSARASLTFTYRFGRSTSAVRRSPVSEEQDKRIENR
jgi:ferric enterobactin receptor